MPPCLEVGKQSWSRVRASVQMFPQKEQDFPPGILLSLTVWRRLSAPQKAVCRHNRILSQSSEFSSQPDL